MTLLARCAIAIALLLASGSILLTAVLYASIQSEGKSRRDQTCEISEKAQQRKEDQLKGTYAFLLDARRNGEQRSTLYTTIIASLPKQEKEARIDEAPKFCDEPGVGLKEPDPPVPQRPPGL